MKSFKFQLDTVLDYKTQVLDALKIEHAAILAQINEQNQVIEIKKTRYSAYNREYTQQKELGMTIADAMKYQVGLQVLSGEILREEERLVALEKLEEKKREEVVEAKKDTASIEKLRQIKRKLYDKALLKEEETMLDELVASRRVVANA